MAISDVLNVSSLPASIKTNGEQPAAAANRPPESESPPAESARVQLSAVGQARSAAAQSEAAAAAPPDNNNPEAAAVAAAAVREQARQDSPPQQGFSFNGVAAFNRIFSS